MKGGLGRRFDQTLPHFLRHKASARSSLDKEAHMESMVELHGVIFEHRAAGEKWVS